MLQQTVNSALNLQQSDLFPGKKSFLKFTISLLKFGLDRIFVKIKGII